MDDGPDANIDVPTGKQRKVGWQTDVGKVRETDEDCVSVSSFGGAFGTVHLLAVADGMGGHAKGEVASKIALSRIWVESFSKIAVPELLNGKSFYLVLKKGFEKANEDILEYTSKNPEASGMGTTSVCAIVQGNDDVTLANVGDSRAYVIGDKGIRQETKDHSFVQELVDKHEITEDQAKDHPDKNVITKAVGISSYLEADIKTVHLENDESLLLCCDGVITHLSDDDIKKIVQETPDPQHACKKIVDMANDKGGTDNISLIILSKPLDLKELDSKKLSEYEDNIAKLQESQAEDQHKISELETALAKSQEENKDLTKEKGIPELFKELEDKKMQKEEKLKQKQQKWEAKLAELKYLQKQQEKEK
ncbi:Stp1/IreP family PP2C-type Ser/Thr phosphatase [Marine Group I thaumarchaeote]|uniref:Stp1/IreP family PP2C-type Ser/Thr phosphatase n=1 Tax=Marine Group I thaumarchaeote TaxID=2511932 RepID=A0A7K4NPK8_9ARCH|nr:Stp1/IreP family PP2C-type Ser/Thr phosphatase [Marine Group I thaumarchaeote]